MEYNAIDLFVLVVMLQFELLLDMLKTKLKYVMNLKFKFKLNVWW